jgi:hypothetical protein
MVQPHLREGGRERAREGGKEGGSEGGSYVMCESQKQACEGQ